MIQHTPDEHDDEQDDEDDDDADDEDDEDDEDDDVVGACVNFTIHACSSNSC